MVTWRDARRVFDNTEHSAAGQRGCNLDLGAVGVGSASAQAPLQDVLYLLPAPASLPAFAPWMIAKQRGYFAAEGLNVTFQVARGGVDVAKQVGAGNAVVGGAIGDRLFYHAGSTLFPRSS